MVKSVQRLYGDLRQSIPGYCVRRFMADGCLQRASELSYTSLLAIVPLLAIALAILAAFPVMEGQREQLKEVFVGLVTPEGEAAIADYFDLFLNNVKSLTIPGILGLSVTAVLLLSTINSALNRIWRISERRALATRLLVYWSLLTLGPMLVGASLSLSGTFFAMARMIGQSLPVGTVDIVRISSTLLASIGFFLLFWVVPSRPVRRIDALIGGLIAAVLLELLKIGFGFYIQSIPTFKVIYGALATIPIFLIWLYSAWAVVLFGAEVTAALPEWRAGLARRGEQEDQEQQILALALSLLIKLRKAQTQGEAVRESRLQWELPVSPMAYDQVMLRLRDGHFVLRATGGKLALARDLDEVTLGDLIAVLRLRLLADERWPSEMRDLVDQLEGAQSDWRSRSLMDIIEPMMSTRSG